MNDEMYIAKKGYLDHHWPQSFGRRTTKKRNQSGRKQIRRKSNGTTDVRVSIILLMWESGLVINPKYRLNNSENIISKLQPPIFVKVAGGKGQVEGGGWQIMGIFVLRVDTGGIEISFWNIMSLKLNHQLCK